MKDFFMLCCFVFAISSCTVQERIIFDSNMGGTYESSFDLSSMLAMAAANSPKSDERKQEKVDTLIVFNDILEQMKDSIATLSPEKRAELEKMRDMTIHMVMDDAEEVFRFTANKTFEEFSEIEYVSYQMDEVFKQVKQQNASTQAGGPGGDMMKTDKVRYTFENNIFRRVDPKVLAKEERLEEDIIDETEEEEAAEDSMMKGMMAEFDDMLAESQMSLQYTFPKKIKSVSNKDAVISADGKTVTYKVDWKTLMENKDLLKNFEVTLEE